MPKVVLARVTILGILALGQIVFSKPASVRAQTTCQQCAIEFKNCQVACFRLPFEEQNACLTQCQNELTRCSNSCT